MRPFPPRMDRKSGIAGPGSDEEEAEAIEKLRERPEGEFFFSEEKAPDEDKGQKEAAADKQGGGEGLSIHLPGTME